MTNGVELQILTTDDEMNSAIWEYYNEIGSTNQKEIEIQSIIKKNFDPNKVHELFIITQDTVLLSAKLLGLILIIKKIFFKNESTSKLRITIKGAASFDLESKVREIGCELKIDKE